MKLVYGIHDKPKFGQVLVFAFQQLLAILAATIAVPAIIGNEMSQSAALFGAGVGTLVYLLFTKFNSPVFLGSSFAFIGSMMAAFAGGVSMSLGYLGLILGTVFAGLVYVVIALAVKFAGVKWIDKLMPAVVIGPTVSIIGLSLAGNAVGDLTLGKYYVDGASSANPYVALICGLVTLFTVVLCSCYGKKMLKLIPFIIGILAGYLVATLFTVVGILTDNTALMVIDFGEFSNMKFFAIPDFTFVEALKGVGELNGTYIATVAVAYIPVAFVVFAEHIADHKNLSTVINKDLLEDPGLHNTLLGDGIGSAVGAFFGGCANTTYGESISCVALSKNGSTLTIFAAGIMSMALAFFSPFVAVINMLPKCVMGGACIAMYGFIAVSGLQMLKDVDLSDNRNLYPVAAILVIGIGGVTLDFGTNKITGGALFQLTSLAVAMIVGILVNALTHSGKDKVENGAIQEDVPETKQEDTTEVESAE